jgi:ribosomal protein S18 acetylase RimI-like enzyme
MPEVRIRKAREDELGTIKKMAVKEMVWELDEEEMKDKERIEREGVDRLGVFLKKEGNEFYVAEVGGAGEMAGYLWFGISERPFSGMKVGWIYDIEVLPSYRGKGVGEALMRHALKVSRERGFGQAGLMVNSKNKVALSLYEKLGFQTEFRIMTRRDGNPVSS